MKLDELKEHDNPKKFEKIDTELKLKIKKIKVFKTQFLFKVYKYT